MNCNRFIPTFNRRDMLQFSANGFGLMALAGLLDRASAGEAKAPAKDADPLAPRKPHFAAKAKRIIFLFMHGGPSQVDTFDPKPLLTRDHGKPYPGKKPRIQFSKTGNLLASPWKFEKRGKSGLEVSELFPEMATCVDDMCVVRSLVADNTAHGGALLQLHTGSDTFIRPSIGSWVTYGLGSENRNLPGFLTISPTHGHGGVQNWSSVFLPAAFQGTPIGNSEMKIKDATIRYIKNLDAPKELQRLQLDLLKQMNEDHLKPLAPDPALEGRINSFELAFRMQTEAPELMDLSKETKETRALYGIDEKETDNFGRVCLLARRFAEKGVRFIQCTHSYKWDQHVSLKKLHTQNAKETDKPIAGLLKDLKRLDLLKDTLVWWGGEFGRTPVGEGGKGNEGRDHNPHGFTMWLAGGGVKGGIAHGATDDYGWYALEDDKVHIHDMHATILHLLGLNHEKLTYRYAGRDFRLTDVAGNVVKKILA